MNFIAEVWVILEEPLHININFIMISKFILNIFWKKIENKKHYVK